MVTDMDMCSAEQADDVAGPLPEAMELHKGAGAGECHPFLRHISAMHEVVRQCTWALMHGVVRTLCRSQAATNTCLRDRMSMRLTCTFPLWLSAPAASWPALARL